MDGCFRLDDLSTSWPCRTSILKVPVDLHGWLNLASQSLRAAQIRVADRDDIDILGVDVTITGSCYPA